MTAAALAYADEAMALCARTIAAINVGGYGDVFDSNEPPPMVPNDVDNSPVLPKTQRPTNRQSEMERVLKQKATRHSLANEHRAAIEVQRAALVAITGTVSGRKMVAASFPFARKGAEEANKAVAAEEDIGPWPDSCNAQVSSCVRDPAASWDTMDRSLALQGRLLTDKNYCTLASLTGPPLNLLKDPVLVRAWKSLQVLFRAVIFWIDGGSHKIAKLDNIPEELADHLSPGQKKAKCNLLAFRPGDALQPHSEDCRRVLSADWAGHSFADAMDASQAWRWCERRAYPRERVCGAKLCKVHSTVDLSNARKTVKAVDCPLAGKYEVLVPVFAMDGAELQSIFGRGKFYDERGAFQFHSVTWKGDLCPFHKLYGDPATFRSHKYLENFKIDANLQDQFPYRMGPDAMRHILQVVWCPDHLCALHVAGAVTNTLRWVKLNQTEKPERCSGSLYPIPSQTKPVAKGRRRRGH